MYLKRLELQGFKSFADKTVLEFRPGITSVIGPNGSGKSNISDSIRWVLGEQSMKSLRGAKSEDIIFAGTQNRKSLGFAEASIVIDNSDGKLPIEFSEVTVTRKLYRSGESGYFINKAPCRLKDILELFMDTGIGKDGYSIIGQGKIDEILSNKSEDRRHIFEEASGIVKYRVRKAESEKKLEHTKLNLLRINDILSEIESNIEPLKIQSEKARKFLDLREELKNIEIGLFLANIDIYKEKLDKIVIDEDILKSQNEDAEKKQEEIKSIKEKLKQEIDNITEEIEQIQNLGFESQREVEQLNSQINVAKERIANNNENFTRYSTEIEEIKLRIDELQEEEKQKLEKKERLSTNKEKFAKELVEKEKELHELTSKLSSKELEIESKKKVVENKIDKKYELQSEINANNINNENLLKREKSINTELQSSISDLDNTRIIKEEISKEFQEIEANKNEITKKLSNAVQEKNNCVKKIKDYEDEINRKSHELRMKDSRYKFLVETEKEKEGYIKSVKSLLIACEKDSNLNKGVHGVLANLITVPKQYETAIEMCLGATLQNIVTENEETAKNLIKYLRQNNLGRASFLPISSIKSNKVEKINEKSISGVIGIAANLVKVDKKYEQIIYNLLGRTVIVEDMDVAIKFSRQNKNIFRIVTLKGDIINQSGGITGGSVANKTVNILGRSREIQSLEKEIIELKNKIQYIEEEKNKYTESIKTILENVDKLEEILQNIDIKYATEKQKLLSIEENLNKEQAKIEKLKEDKNNIQMQTKENIIKRQKLEKEEESISKEIESINIDIEEFTKLNKDNQKYIDDLNIDITNLRISVSSFDESEASIEEISQRIKQDIQNNKLSIENKEKGKDEILQSNKRLEEEIKLTNEKISQINYDVKNSGTQVEELKNNRIQKNDKLNKIEDDISNQFKIIEELKEQIVKIEVKKTKIEQDLEEVINKMWEEYELTPNTQTEYKKPENIQATQKEVNYLRNQIRDLGSINIDSIEEYKQTKERYDFMCEQRLDLENTSNKLRKIINDMTSTMKEQFRTQFEIINKNFGEVFAQLFGGGKAELILTDEENILECGIDIRVQPPGKKLQNMMLLSGGEKAFTAIALLFAILKINPSPFCVLDEIEAALDDVNVYRFAEYLKKFTSETQFLVITHRKGTMEAADTVYGITMQENGISKMLSIRV